MVDRADPVTAGDRGGPPGWAVALIGAAQAAVLVWWLVVPLPNAENLRADAITRGDARVQSLRRFHFLFAPDEVVADAAAGLGTPGQLTDRLPIVLAALLIGGAAWSLGSLSLLGFGLRARFPAWARWAICYGLGSTLLGAMTLVAGRFGLLEPVATQVALGAIAMAGLGVSASVAFQRRREGSPAGRHRWPAVAVVLALLPLLGLMALGAMQPTIEYDAIEYHLRGPREYHEAGRIDFLPHNVYTSMPSAVEMLHLLGMTVLDDWYRGALAGQLLIAAFAPATAAMIALAAIRWGSGGAALLAAFVYLTTPWAYRLAVFPFVEGPLCFFHAALVVVSGIAMTTDRPSRPWLLGGLLAGGAMATKYPGLVSAVVPFGAVTVVDAIRRRSWSAIPAFAAGVAIAVGPWLIRNVVDTGNPVYPLAFGIFGGRDWDEALDARWWDAHGPRPATGDALVAGLLDVAGRSDWQGPLFVLLAPLALRRRETRRPAAWLACYVAYLFVTWFLLTHRLDRFWLPLLPAAAVLAGWGAGWSARRGWVAWMAALIGLVTVTNLTLILSPLSGPTDWTVDLGRLRREVPARINPPLARLDEVLPADARPLLVGQAATFYVRHPVVGNTVFDREILAAIVEDRSPAEIRRELDRRRITHVYVDWSEIDRHRKPGGYGFSEVIDQALFDRLVADGVLGPSARIGNRQVLYEVVGAGTRWGRDG